MYIGPPTVATRSLLLPFPFMWCMYLLDLAHGQDACKADRFGLHVLKIVQVVGGRVPSAPISCKAAPPAPYLANSLSLPYFKYASIWT